MHERWNQFVMITAAATLAAVLGFAYGNTASELFTLEKWQSLVGTGIAVALGLLAWFASRSNARLSVLTREEDRIEETLPGLLQAQNTMSQIAVHLRGIMRPRADLIIASHFRLEGDDTAIEDDIAARLPLVDKRLLREMTEAITGLYFNAVGAEAATRAIGQLRGHIASLRTAGASRELTAAQEGLRFQEEYSAIQFDSLERRLTAFVLAAGDIAARANKAQRRLAAIRREIDRYFPD